jgi:hypothetical protein
MENVKYRAREKLRALCPVHAPLAIDAKNPNIMMVHYARIYGEAAISTPDSRLVAIFAPHQISIAIVAAAAHCGLECSQSDTIGSPRPSQ